MIEDAYALVTDAMTFEDFVNRYQTYTFLAIDDSGYFMYKLLTPMACEVHILLRPGKFTKRTYKRIIQIRDGLFQTYPTLRNLFSASIAEDTKATKLLTSLGCKQVGFVHYSSYDGRHVRMWEYLKPEVRDLEEHSGSN